MMTLQLTALEEQVERFLDSAARGDLAQVTQLLQLSPSLLNRTGEGGWTALMLAARNGHRDVVETLLTHGCDRFSVNSSSQTALDISRFWGHRHVSDLLCRTDGVSEGVLPGCDLTQRENYFSRETLDRLSGKRTDTAWLEERQKDARTVYILFNNLSPMVSSTHKGETKLCVFRYEAVKDLLQKPDTVIVFLGVEKKRRHTSSSSSSSSSPQKEVQQQEEVQQEQWEPPAWFAFNSDGDADDLLRRCREKNCCFTKTTNRDLLMLREEEAGVLAQARSVLAWHSRYSFCPTCGSSTVVEEGGYKRRCMNSSCRSQKGVHNTCYPRVDPVVIMLVIHPDGDQCLLGRKKIFPKGMFSCLAGFVEPGESLEEAVRREVEEESGVRVGPVQYVSCQPWPMPSSLMIGCLAVAMSTGIKVDESEIEEARWFPRQQVIDSLLRSGRPTFTFPPRQTIAHQLIKHWIGINSNL